MTKYKIVPLVLLSDTFIQNNSGKLIVLYDNKSAAVLAIIQMVLMDLGSECIRFTDFEVKPVNGGKND
jgi:hypothetical protein